ncbi:protein of unknown function [Candidatus Methylomirabilis oxygeniifera]|uniref:Uncharacterized protein n=1 Tax=Methylomirabilis oxygeniifera TaxID=671143 RepID=D5MF37_METO1|nr:protein of unknown function [Candidatus Methylomirabilis oxyfera]
MKAYDSNIPLIIDWLVRYPGFIGGTDIDPNLAADRNEAAHTHVSLTPSKPSHP